MVLLNKSLCFICLQANEVLQSFLKAQVATKESILQADEALTTGEKDLAGTGKGSDHRGEGSFLYGPVTGKRAKRS